MSVSRLFVGTFLSAEQQLLLGQLCEDNDSLVSLWGYKLRWVKAAKLHMTWSFLGDVATGKVPELAQSLSAVVAGRGRCQVSYDNLVFWPSAAGPRQMVLTPAVVSESVAVMAADMRRSLSECTAQAETREFCPHITLTRFDVMSKPKSAEKLSLPEWFPAHKFLPLVHRITSVDLIVSHIGSMRDDYEVVRSFPLV